MAHRYYLTQRPPSPGTFPNKMVNKVIDLYSCGIKEYFKEIDCEAWGWIEYEKPLEIKEIDDYELMKEKYPKEYTIQEVFEFPVGTIFLESHGFKVEIVDIEDGDKALIGLWLDKQDNHLELTSIWVNEKFTKA